MPKRTFHPSAIRRKKNQGFMSRNRSKRGKKVLRRRIIKGRKKLV